MRRRTAGPCAFICASVPTAPPSCTWSALRVPPAQPAAAAHQRRGPAGALEAEAGDRGRLHQRARQHRRLRHAAAACCQQRLRGDGQIGLDRARRLARDERHRRCRSRPGWCCRNARTARRRRRRAPTASLQAPSPAGWRRCRRGRCRARCSATSNARPCSRRRSTAAEAPGIRPSAACARASAASKRSMASTKRGRRRRPGSRAWTGSRRRCSWRPASVAQLRHGAQLVGGRGAEAEELQVGRDHLEQHVGADLHRAALGLGGLQAAACTRTSSPPRRRRSPARCGRCRTAAGRLSFMPSGVALTTTSKPAGSLRAGRDRQLRIVLAQARGQRLGRARR